MGAACTFALAFACECARRMCQKMFQRLCCESVPSWVSLRAQCLMQAIAAVKPGLRYRELGAIISKHAESNGCAILSCVESFSCDVFYVHIYILSPGVPLSSLCAHHACGITSSPGKNKMHEAGSWCWQAVGGEDVLRARHRGAVPLRAQHPALPWQQGRRHHEGGPGEEFSAICQSCLHHAPHCNGADSTAELLGSASASSMLPGT